MEMDCIPSGMELFPAMDEDQLNFIKKVIDDCDYYLILIGGRYGSVTPEGVSYTEKEYDYAIERGLKVIGLIHGAPGAIPVDKTDRDPVLAARLEKLKEKVKTGRLVKEWTVASELPGIVALSLTKTIKMYPGVGWIRGDAVASNELLEEMNSIRKKNAELEKLLDSTPVSSIAMDDIAGLEENFLVSGTYRASYDDDYAPWRYQLQLGKIFGLIAPHLLSHPHDELVKEIWAQAIFEEKKQSASSVELNDNAFQTLKIQFKGLGLVDLKYRDSDDRRALHWSLTSTGEREMMRLRVLVARSDTNAQ